MFSLRSMTAIFAVVAVAITFLLINATPGIDAAAPHTSSVYVANEWSRLTTESPAPSGYTYTSQVFSTFSEPGKTIPLDSDLVKVVIEDSGRDVISGETAPGATIDVDNAGDGPAGDDNILTATAGQQVTIFLTGRSSTPIVGGNEMISIMSGGVDIVGSGMIRILDRFDGSESPVADPWIRIQRNYGSNPVTIDEIGYQTSTADSVVVAVNSVLDLVGVVVLAQETGPSTGRFEGFVRLVAGMDPTVPPSVGSTVPGDKDAAIRTVVFGSVFFIYTDWIGIQRQTSTLISQTLPDNRTGSIFVSNEWSKITNESPAPAGYTFETTVYGTYSEAGRTIEPNSDLVKVVVTDPGMDISPSEDNVAVAVRSDVDFFPGITVLAVETGPNTGRFEGFVRLVESTVSSSVGSTVPGDMDAQIRVATWPLTLDYTDSVNVLTSAQVIVDLAPQNVSAQSIFSANEWSKRTNENPAPAGYVSANTIFGTYAEADRLVQPDSDLVKLAVSDTGLNLMIDVIVPLASIDIDDDNNGLDAGDDNTLSSSVGEAAVIFLTGHAVNPVSGTLSDVQANTSIKEGVNELNGDELTIVSFYQGDGVNDPWIQAVVNIEGPYVIDAITYQTSETDTVSITVKSDVQPDGIDVLALETGLSTGRFEGYVRLVPSTVSSSTGSTVPGDTDAQIRTLNGPVTFEFVDSDAVVRQTTLIVDTVAPVVTVNGPVDGSATQNRYPVFSGSVNDTASGIDISTVQILIDGSDDALNLSPVVNLSGVASGSAIELGPSTTGSIDGDATFLFSQGPFVGLPLGVFVPDHVVDWVIKASDMAGNLGFSDADLDDSSSQIIGGYQIHTVRIDKILPSFLIGSSNHITGVARSGEDEIAARSSIRVVFNEGVANVQGSDFVVTLDSGALVVPTEATVFNYPINPPGFAGRGLVYLTLAVDLSSGETPVVSIQDAISDLAGNFTTAGSTNIADGIPPILTLTLSGGTGTGTGSENAGGLTNAGITIGIISDEFLAAVPVVEVHDLGSPASVLTPSVVATGPKSWEATVPAGLTEGLKAVVISAVDIATNVTSFGDVNTPGFRVDTSIPAPVMVAGPVGGSGKILSSTPTFTIDFAANGEQVSVNLPEVLLDGSALTDPIVPSNGNRTFSVTLSTPIANGLHSISIPAGTVTDVAGNILAQEVSLDDFEIDSVARIGFSVSPDVLPVRTDEPSVVTVSVDDLGAIVPDTVQINLAHDDGIVLMQNPECVGLFAGGTTSAVARDTDDLGSFFTCSLIGGTTGVSGPIASFELIRVSTGNPTVGLRLDGDAPTSLVTSGVVTGVPEASPTLDILPGTRITGQISMQGARDAVAFAAISPMLTLQNTGGGSPFVVSPDTDGTFMFTGVFDGTYDLTATADGFIDLKLAAFIISAADLDLQPVEVRGGLADENDIVEAVDISAAVGNYGLGPPDLNGRRTQDTDLVVDFDGDGFVTGFDISIVVSNFGSTRPQIWIDPSAIHVVP